MEIIGIEGMTPQTLYADIQRGGKFVYFEYCVSILILTFKRSSNIYFIPPGEGTFSKSIGFILISLLFGWWGFPWGPIYTITSLATNLGGGKDVTHEVWSSLHPPVPSASYGPPQ